MRYKLELFLSGDYKFLLLILGMKSATSNHSCIWCKVHMNQRWDMTKELHYYNTLPLQRTFKEVMEMCSRKGRPEKYSCEHEPLIRINLDHVVIDELHLLLRIMDVLLNNIVDKVVAWHKKDNFAKRKCERSSVHLDNLQSTIRSCRVSFESGRKEMRKGTVVVTLILLVFLVLTRKNSWQSFQTNCRTALCLKHATKLFKFGNNSTNSTKL